MSLAIRGGLIWVLALVWMGAIVRSQPVSLPCEKTGNFNDTSTCMFEGDMCNWSTDFSNFINESIAFDAYQAAPVPSPTRLFVIESGKPFYADGALQIQLSPPASCGPRGFATIVSTTRFMHYGTFEVVLKQTGHPGVITSAILFSNDLDEIDLEITGRDLTEVQANWYAKGKQVLDSHGSSQHVGYGKTNTSNASNFHRYRIDWTPASITWSINGQVMFVARAKDDGFPEAPSRISFGVWQAQIRSQWAGFPNITDWSLIPTARFQSMRVACAPRGSSNDQPTNKENGKRTSRFSIAAMDANAETSSSTISSKMSCVGIAVVAALMVLVF